MRIAALYDVHGNLPALEAVLDEVRRADVDEVVVGGDVVPGPMPREALATLLALELPVRFIRGNGDREVAALMAGEAASVPERFQALMRWNAAQLLPEHRALLCGWPATLRLDVAGVGPVLFCHATPRSDSEIFTRLTATERLTPIFAGLGVSMVVCGHTHMQFDRTIGGVRVVNAGSVGMPFGATGAHWLLLGPDVRLQRTSYDLAAAAARIRRTAYPQAEEFASTSVLQPPGEDDMLAAFARAELA
jgi:predicted phosphodiesterase